MLDIGLGEIVVMAILALLVFGPDRLPKVAADAARTLRQIRAMAAAARRDLTDAAGLQDGDLAGAMKDLSDLDPRRALRGVLTDEPKAADTAQRPPVQRPPAPRAPGTVGSPANGSTDTGSPGSTGALPTSPPGTIGAGAAAPASTGSSADLVSDSALPDAPAPDSPVDPDWT